MRAVVIREHGGPETLAVTTEPDPIPGPGEALVRVKACSLNYLDTWVRRGVPGHKFPLPIIPGSDVAGVLQSADVPGFSAGDEVVAAPFVSCGRCDACLSGEDVACRDYRILGENRNGGCAELITVPSTHLFPKPANLSFEEAAASLLAPLTAYRMVNTRARVVAGESVLVTAAAGGVGTAAIQWARLAGARVTALVGSAHKADAVLELGAEKVVVIPGDQDPFETVRSDLGRVSFEVIIDSVGGRFLEAGVRWLKPFGRLVTCGATSAPTATLDLRRLFFLSLSIMGSTMGSRWELAQVLRAAASGTFRPIVHAVLPLDALGEAQGILEDRRVIGKVVVRP